MVHDSQFDYYAKKLATCSSDRTIKVFEVVKDVTGDKYRLISTLSGHEGPVWQISWAHPKFGVLLASCSYDGSVIVHREASQNSWNKVYEHRIESSVNSIAWAPHEYGLLLACASSDGFIAILEFSNDNWYDIFACQNILHVHFSFVDHFDRTVSKFKNDALGCNSVSWAPYNAIGSLTNDIVLRRLVTGSCDKIVKVWRSAPGSDWEQEDMEGSQNHGG